MRPAAFLVLLLGLAGIVRADPAPQPAPVATAAEDPDVTVARAARAFGQSPEFLMRCRLALEAIYARDYATARERFEALDHERPELGMGALGHVLILQARMLENFDYAHEEDYWRWSGLARKKLEAAIEVPGNEAFERFLLGGIVGIEGIHLMRREAWLPALARGLDGIRQLDRLEELAPDLADLDLAYGLYAFWRTVIGMRSPLLPTFGDRREEGLARLRRAREQAAFVGPPATMALTYAHMEEHRYATALHYGLENLRQWPRNIINRILVARLQIRTGHLKEALANLHAVLDIDPDNHRAHFYIGLVRLRTGRLRMAERHLRTYLESDPPKPYAAATWLLLGDVARRRGAWDEARQRYEKAREMGEGLARRRLAAVEEARKRKEGAEER